MSVRSQKVSSLLHRELGTIISRNYSGGTLGFTTVTEVRMTPDLKLAKIYVSIFGSAKQKQVTLARMETEKSHIRTMLAAKVSMKYMPALMFYHDDTMDRVDNLENLIKQIHKDDPQPE